MKAELTIAEAAAAVGRTPAAIYQWIDAGDLRATDTKQGMIVRLADVQRVAGRKRRGRPRGTSKHS